MKREEEIEQAALEAFFPFTQESLDIWIEGAEWADEHPRKGLVDVELILKEIDKRLKLVKDPFEHNIHTTRIVEVYESLKEYLQRWRCK